jgi:hypothetical protein
VYDHLVHNWMEERTSSIETAISTFLSDIEAGKYQMQHSDDALVGSTSGPSSHELEPLINLRDCHSLFWPTESKKESNGICPLTAANSHWWESSGMSHFVNTCECEGGYDLNIVDMICHLQTHNHWIAKVAALVVMEHDVTTGLHSLREPQSSIKESRSPYQPQVPFIQPSTGGAKTENETSDDKDIKQIKRTFQGYRRKNQMLAGIEESSSAEKESLQNSDSNTASESKCYKAFQEARYKSKNAIDATRSSMRLRERRKKRDILTGADDGESSVDSGLSNLDF